MILIASEKCKRRGEMAELVEGARLEIVYTGNRIKGSNPFLSARKVPIYGGFFIYTFFNRAPFLFKFQFC